MSVKNRTAPGPDRIRPEHLKSLPPVLINTLARLFTRYLSECKVPKQRKTSKTVLLYKKGDAHDIGNYRPICLLSVIYKLFTRVILNRIEKVLDEGQPCEQAGFRKGFSTIDHIHTVSKLTEVSREYKMPLCLTFIDLKKAFDSVEMEAVVEALDNQGVPTQYIKVLRQLYSNFTTGISPFYKNIIIDVKRGVRQGDTISPKIFTATLENAMRKLEWDDMGVNVDGRQLHHLRFADDIVLITSSISQAERILTEFDETCGCIGLQLNLQKTMFMRNGWVSDVPFTLNGTNISECTSYVYLGREPNMMNDLTPELGKRRRAAWGAYKSIEDVVKKTRNTRGTVKRVPADSPRMPPRHNVPSGYAGGYANISRRGHAPVVHEDADNRHRCPSYHRDAENCAVTRKYVKKSGHAPSLIALTRHDRGMLEIPPGPSLHAPGTPGSVLTSSTPPYFLL
ncbi:hypothetical protein RB195_008083 [Necator americanus]|uniref:Reverse transcriptase domain-containing protein n=1 Tax=Necator americanus TaxID=51031 RepID=A0ABR1CLY3_NECAM